LGEPVIYLNQHDLIESALSTDVFGGQKTMTSYFILTVIDSIGMTSINVAAHKIAEERLAKCFWPLYNNTQNRNALSAGDCVLVYVGGKLRYSQSFVAKAVVVTSCLFSSLPDRLANEEFFA
jgi:hypothetical protein